MSIKNILVAGVAVAGLIAFGIVAFSAVLSAQNEKQLKDIQIKDKTLHIKRLQTEQQEAEKLLNEALEDKDASQQKLDEAQKKSEEVERQLKEKEAQLLSKNAAKAKLASATVATPAPAGGSCNDWIAQAGITHPIAYDLIGRENRKCNPCIYNNGSPTGAVDCNYAGENAYGIPQAMPGNKMAIMGADWRTNPVTQLKWMQWYVIDRYKSWEGAKAHHDAYGWY
jgi:hypothetical protein